MKFTKKPTFYILFIATLTIFAGVLTGCQKAAQKSTGAIVTFQLSPSTHGVDDFMELLGDYEPEYASDTCYNVTPKEIRDKYGFNIYKFDTSCNSFLEYEQKVYPLGTGFGGFGATSFAIADINNDGAAELYFTYSWGSGLHRSQAGYFDTAYNAMVELDFVHYNNDSVLGADGLTLCLYDASCNTRSFVDIELSAGENWRPFYGSQGKYRRWTELLP